MTSMNVKTWCENNVYKLYGDRDDSLTVKQAESLLECATNEELVDTICNIECEIDDHLMDYRNEIEYEQYKNMCNEIGLEQSEELFDSFRDHFMFDTSDYVKGIFNNTNFHIVATPLYEGEPIEAPCVHDHDETTNMELIEILEKALGISVEEGNRLTLESCYSGAYLRVCGSLDFGELYREQTLPQGIMIDNTSSHVYHNSGNGSGSCWEPKITKEVTLSARFRIDDNWRYGVQSVYGMSHSFWNNELVVIYTTVGEV